MNYDAERRSAISLGRLRKTMPPDQYEILVSDPSLAWCGKCKQLKDRSEFYKDSRRPNGLLTRCKVCIARTAHDWWAENSPNEEWRKKWNERTQRLRAVSRQHDLKKVRASVKNTALKSTYGLTLQEFEELRSAQNNACAICTRQFGDDRQTGAHVDHCHNSKKVRGLLCNNCNNGLGRFQDDPEVLRSAARYIEEARQT